MSDPVRATSAPASTLAGPLDAGAPLGAMGPTGAARELDAAVPLDPAGELGRTGERMAGGRVGRVHQVNVSPGGVPKLPVPGARVHRLGLVGDGHTEPEPIHGGPDAAVSLYSVEAIARVAADGHTAFPGAFGENLTLEGLDWQALRAGDRIAIGQGGLEIELTKHAAPCTTLQDYFADGRFARISHKLHPEDARWYARVLREGPVAPGDRVAVLEAPTDF